MTTGMIRPAISLLEVRALNCLQNSMMLTCAWPSAGPTGGAGVALPATICNLTYPVIFFGAIFLFLLLCCGHPQAPRKIFYCTRELRRSGEATGLCLPKLKLFFASSCLYCLLATVCLYSSDFSTL